MKICMITTRHSLDDARVVHKEAKSLSAAGHEVTLIFPCNERYEYTRFDGKVIVQGTAPDGEANHAGLRVIGLPKRNGLVGKIRTVHEVSKLAARQSADVYHVHEPDLSLLIAVRAKILLRKNGIQSRIVHDMHEYPPGEPYDKSGRCLKLPLLFGHILWDKVMMRWVDHIFTANAVVRGYALFLKYTMDVDVLYNGPILKLFPQQTVPHWSSKDGKLILCHEGSLPFDRGLREMVEAIDRLKDRVSLKIVGDVFGEERNWLDQELERRKLKESIICTGWLPYNQVNNALKGAHAGLILFRECMENRMAGPPNKLFNYMNAGLPVLSVAFPEMHRIISEEKCGILIHNQTVESIVGAIEKILENPEESACMGAAGQKAIRERYSWEQMEKNLLSAYQTLSHKL
jgi:glycosyltransferase involved in cell wall biosynthesis